MLHLNWAPLLVAHFITKVPMYTKMLNDEVKSIGKDIQKGLHKCFVKKVAEWKSSGSQKVK